MKFAGNPETQAGHQVTFSPQTFDANMQSHSERQSPSSQDIRQHGFSSKSKIALDDCTQAGDLGERRRIENSVLQRNYRTHTSVSTEERRFEYLADHYNRAQDHIEERPGFA